MKAIKQLLQNPNIRSASGAMIAYGLGAGLLALSGFLLARFLGPEGMGTYDFAEAWVEVLLPITVLGLDRLVIRQIPVYMAQEQYGLLTGVWQYARKQAQIMSLLMAIGLSLFFLFWFSKTQIVFTTSTIGQLPHLIISNINQAVLYSTLLAVVLLVIRVRIRLQQALLQSIRFVTRSLLPDFIIRLLIFMVLISIYYFIFGAISPAIAMALHVLGGLMALLVGEILMRYLLPSTMKQKDVQEEKSVWLKQSVRFAIIAGVILATSRISTIFLGSLSSFEQTSFYSISLRITMLITLPQLAITSFIQPRIAQLYSEKRLKEMQWLVVLSIRGTMVIASLLILPVFLTAPWILRILGDGYAPALPVIFIVAIGQFVSLSVGPSAPILMMTGYEKDLIVVVVAAMILVIVFNLALVPSYGASGAAIATTIGLSATNIGQFAVVRWRLGIWALPFTPKFK
jgi:O-antigen/teichoic acid export membrane protein